MIGNSYVLVFKKLNKVLRKNLVTISMTIVNVKNVFLSEVTETVVLHWMRIRKLGLSFFFCPGTHM